MKLDVLAFAAHPDDAELGCGATLAKLAAQGRQVGIIDLTQGELGTRGSAGQRLAEAEAASKALGVPVRENMFFRDAFFTNDEAHQRALARVIRRYRPDVVLHNAPSDRHPDHGRACELVRNACFLSGLRRIETEDAGVMQEAWRPGRVFAYIQDKWFHPTFVVDVSAFFEHKLEAIRAFRSQFHNPDSAEPETYISRPVFLDYVEARAREMGHFIGAPYGEGFLAEYPLELDTPLS